MTDIVDVIAVKSCRVCDLKPLIKGENCYRSQGNICKTCVKEERAVRYRTDEAFAERQRRYTCERAKRLWRKDEAFTAKSREHSQKWHLKVRADPEAWEKRKAQIRDCRRRRDAAKKAGRVPATVV